MSIALFLLMPAVLVIGTLVLICRKIIFRSLISKYKTEKPDSYDAESYGGVRLWESNVHHQYHDLRQRSNITGWHSDIQIPPPFHPPQHTPQHMPHQQYQQHLPQAHFASPPIALPPPPIIPIYPIQHSHAGQYLPHQAVSSVHIENISSSPITSGLPRPAGAGTGGVRAKPVKAPSPVPMTKKSSPVAGSLVSSSIDSADVSGRAYVLHKPHYKQQQQSTADVVQAQQYHNQNLPPLVVTSTSVSPFCTQPSTAVHSPIFSPSDSFYDESNDPEDGLSQSHSMQTPTTQSSGDMRYAIKQIGSDNDRSMSTTSRTLGNKKNSAVNFFSGEYESRGDIDNVQKISSKSADFLDIGALQPIACRGIYYLSVVCLLFVLASFIDTYFLFQFHLSHS